MVDGLWDVRPLLGKSRFSNLLRRFGERTVFVGPSGLALRRPGLLQGLRKRYGAWHATWMDRALASLTALGREWPPRCLFLHLDAEHIELVRVVGEEIAATLLVPEGIDRLSDAFRTILADTEGLLIGKDTARYVLDRIAQPALDGDKTMVLAGKETTTFMPIRRRLPVMLLWSLARRTAVTCFVSLRAWLARHGTGEPLFLSAATRAGLQGTAGRVLLPEGMREIAVLEPMAAVTGAVTRLEAPGKPVS